MRATALMTILLLQAAAASPADAPPVAQPQYMHFMRTLSVPAGTGQACAVLDAAIFPHAAPSLLDLRLFPSQTASHTTPHELPYAITLSESISEETANARLLNLGAGAAGTIVFDLEMPTRPYTDVTLDLDPSLHDFLATATVSGSAALGTQAKGTALGSFTLFDLTTQHLSRSTALPLAESTFRYLHVALSLSPAPGADSSAARFPPSIVEGAEVTPSREAEAIYTTVTETAAVATSGRESIATLQIPPRVPVERVEFMLAPGFKGNFSRDVRVTATTEPPAKGAAREDSSSQPDMTDDMRAPLPEVVTGSILRVHTTEAGREIHTEQLTLPAILGANLQRAAKVEVAIENGDDQPLPIAAVRLQMRQRRLCFDAVAASAGPLSLYYGDPALAAPVYDYERLFTAAEKPLDVTLGPQLPNPLFTPRPTAPLPFTERHPQVLWIALVAAIAALGLVALRSSKTVGR